MRDTTKHKERHRTITKRPLHHEEIPFLTGYATNLLIQSWVNLIELESETGELEVIFGEFKSPFSDWQNEYKKRQSRSPNDTSLSNRYVGNCPPPKQSETHNFKVDLECLLGQTIFLAMKQKSAYVKGIEITLSVNTTKLNTKCQEHKGKYPNIWKLNNTLLYNPVVTGEFSGSYNIFQSNKNEAEFIKFGEMQLKQCLEENLMH